MDDSLLSFYFEQGKKYAKIATGDENSLVAYYIGGIFFEFRIPEADMQSAFNALTPLILQESLVKDETTNEQSEMDS
ncbi:phage gp6-like head-tail connector protein [Enterococcus sp. LJL128]